MYMGPRQPSVDARPVNDKGMTAILSYGKHYYNYVARGEVIVITKFCNKIMLHFKGIAGPKSK